jgi:hypothetical protein
MYLQKVKGKQIRTKAISFYILKATYEQSRIRSQNPVTQWYQNVTDPDPQHCIVQSWISSFTNLSALISNLLYTSFLTKSFTSLKWSPFPNYRMQYFNTTLTSSFTCWSSRPVLWIGIMLMPIRILPPSFTHDGKSWISLTVIHSNASLLCSIFLVRDISQRLRQYFEIILKKG